MPIANSEECLFVQAVHMMRGQLDKDQQVLTRT